ncbi:UDPglucose--hexose-1-phosphate uridylyltransferase [Desulfurella multipotens]|uniref:Galactose-1-phosphate uridylyltransferase n=1 Tax=Desulfurella multipotens TaxID=79269 RepID=A0A1G6I4B1_9BACT|nr:galactose-1-phosphate uridylyltransferase [Desulfurella multipotens]SDC01334.1 UDPglucose--hexose-1-phosphate uridylyltransferase [Desulfurella multipotens]
MSELRKDPIVERWVIISTERGKRPHDFKQEEQIKITGGFCPFDPGNEKYVPPEIYAVRAPGSQPNDPHWTLRVVPNKFPALGIEGDLDKHAVGLYDAMNGIGAHEVIIETPNHSETLDIMPLDRMKDVVFAYKARIEDLKKDKRMKYVLVFKNYGAVAGASLEHSHSQLIALPIIPKRPLELFSGAKTYFSYKDRCPFCDIIRQELNDKVRLIEETKHFVSITPFASRSPFEVSIFPKKHSTHFEFEDVEILYDFTYILQNTLKRLKIALDNPPYNFVLLNGAFIFDHDDYFHWHLEITPRLTKIAGFEWGSGFYINPTPPEDAAKYLREITL